MVRWLVVDVLDTTECRYVTVSGTVLGRIYKMVADECGWNGKTWWEKRESNDVIISFPLSSVRYLYTDKYINKSINSISHVNIRYKYTICHHLTPQYDVQLQHAWTFSLSYVICSNRSGHFFSSDLKESMVGECWIHAGICDQYLIALYTKSFSAKVVLVCNCRRLIHSFDLNTRVGTTWSKRSVSDCGPVPFISLNASTHM